MIKIIINTIGISILLLSLITCSSQNYKVNIHYLGHASFVMSFDNGIDIVTDYGNENAWLEWGWDSPIYSIGKLIPDVMTFSHQHEDHYDVNRIPDGVKYILTVNDKLTINDIIITNIRTCESNLYDESNSSYIFDYHGLKICHLGDAQAQIMKIHDPIVRDEILKEFPKQLDLLFMTIEGEHKFIAQAEEFIQLLNPRIVIPMHYWSEEYLHKFIDYLNDKNLVEDVYKINRVDESKYELIADMDKPTIEIMVLDRAQFIVP